MNILTSPQTHMMAKGAKPSGDVLDILGEQLVLDPQSLALLKENGSITEGEFQALLEATQGENETLMGMMSGKEAKRELGKSLDAQALSQNPKEANTNKELANVLQLGKSSAKNQVQPQQAAVNNQLTQAEGLTQPKEMLAANKMPVGKPVLGQAVPAKQTPVMNQAATQKVMQSDSGAKLYNLHDFMNKQSSSAKQRAISSNAYKPEQSIFANNMEKPVGETVTKNAVGQTSSLQDLMFGQSNEQFANEAGEEVAKQSLSQMAKPSMSPSANAAKVFDIGSMNDNMTTDQVISKIQDYIIQTKAGNEKQLDFSFTHNDLGKVDLQVQKGQQNSMNIVIGTNTTEGAQFFTQNRGELLQSLSQAGVQVNDLRLDTGSKTANQEFANDSRGSNHGGREHGSQSGQRQEEQQKRETLWQQFYKDKEVA